MDGAAMGTRGPLARLIDVIESTAMGLPAVVTFKPGSKSAQRP